MKGQSNGVRKYFELAAKVAVAKTDRRSFFIGAVAIRGDGVIVTASNGPVVMDNVSDKSYFPSAHAEHRICRKLSKNSVVYVVRIRRGDKKVCNARPCETCQNSMRKRGVKKVIYSIGPDEYGVIIFKK
jgi:deoxycytidylate deaminase